MDKKIGAIANGINIDHIPQGNAWYILKLLKLDRKYPVGIGLNLVSKRLGFKDLVKVENYRLTAAELSLVSLFAYGASYSEIENYVIVRKVQLTLPEMIAGVIICPNHRCISHQQRSKFHLSSLANNLLAECHYCTHKYELNKLSEFNLA